MARSYRGSRASAFLFVRKARGTVAWSTRHAARRYPRKRGPTIRSAAFRYGDRSHRAPDQGWRSSGRANARVIAIERRPSTQPRIHDGGCRPPAPASRRGHRNPRLAARALRGPSESTREPTAILHNPRVVAGCSWLSPIVHQRSAVHPPTARRARILARPRVRRDSGWNERAAACNDLSRSASVASETRLIPGRIVRFPKNLSRDRRANPSAPVSMRPASSE